jgi:hypothetical protein
MNMVPFGDNENVPKLDSGVGCTILWIHKNHWIVLYTFKFLFLNYSALIIQGISSWIFYTCIQCTLNKFTPPSHSHPCPPPPSFSVWWVSLCCLHMYISSILHPLHPSVSFAFFLPLSPSPHIVHHYCVFF